MDVSRGPWRRLSGFGLLEVILVFAIVIGAAGVVFSVFQSAHPSAEAAAEVDDLNTLLGNLRSTWGIQHDYSPLNTNGNAQAIAAHAVPASMIQANTIVNVWGGQVEVVGAYGENGKFVVVEHGISADACVKFVSGVAPSVDDVAFGDHSDDGSDLSAIVPFAVQIGRGPLDQAKLAGFCHQTGDLVFTFRGS